MASNFNWFADDRHGALADDLVNTPSGAGRAAVLRHAGVAAHLDLLEALRRAEVDRNAIVIALADVGRVLPLRLAADVIEDEARDRRLELARAA